MENIKVRIAHSIQIFMILGITFGPAYFASGNTINSDSKPPNIVLIMADDMGYECLSVNGSISCNTPHLDKLAASGIQFSNCYSQPLCTPSRVKIMTGLYNFRNYEDFGYLNPNQTTFGNLLQKEGYATCIAGKWQLNGLNRNNPGNQDTIRPYHFGFDEYCLWQLNRGKGDGERYADPLIIKNGKYLPGDPEKYGPDILSDFVCDFIEKNAGKPFFVYYPMVLPHSPFVPTPDSPAWENTEKRYEHDTKYFPDMVAYIDKIVRKIENALRTHEVWENTIFIFTSDNGTLRTVVTKTANGDVRGGKGLSLNTGNHVPLIVSWPKSRTKGKSFHGIVDFADFLPTLADAAGINPSDYNADGKSFYPVLKGENMIPKNETFIHYTPRFLQFEHNRWVMDGQYKLYRDGRFFNTQIDPHEKNPLQNLTDKEDKIRNRFDAIIHSKEKEFPYEWNNQEFIKKEAIDN